VDRRVEVQNKDVFRGISHFYTFIFRRTRADTLSQDACKSNNVRFIGDYREGVIGQWSYGIKDWKPSKEKCHCTDL
jgi:hypothetical protein